MRMPAIMFGSRKTIGATIMPATAPTIEAKPQPMASIQPTRMPHSRLDTGFWAAARHGEAERREAEERGLLLGGAAPDGTRAPCAPARAGPKGRLSLEEAMGSAPAKPWRSS